MNNCSGCIKFSQTSELSAAVVLLVESTIHWISLYPVDKAFGFPEPHPLDGDSSSGKRYLTFEHYFVA